MILNMRLAKFIKETILEEIVDIMVAIIHGWCDINACELTSFLPRPWEYHIIIDYLEDFVEFH